MFCTFPRQELGFSSSSDSVSPRLLGWHVCRTKLARKIFFEARIFSRKMLRNFPRKFWAFILWVRKNPAKFPANFPPNFPPKNQKKFTNELLQERQENRLFRTSKNSSSSFSRSKISLILSRVVCSNSSCWICSSVLTLQVSWAFFVSVPSDTKLLLTKNYSEIIIFEKLRISYVIPWKSPSFPEILKVRTPWKITKNNSQGIIFVIISCQRVVVLISFRSREELKPPKPRKVSKKSPERSLGPPRPRTPQKSDKKKAHKSGRIRPRQGTEICIFGAPSPLEALHWIFCFFSSIDVQFSKTSPLKSGESSEKSSGKNRVKSCHVCGCHGFFRPWININFLVWLPLWRPRDGPRDKPRFSPCFTQWKPGLFLGQTQFVPGQSRGRRAAEKVYVLKVYVPFWLARKVPRKKSEKSKK